MHNGKDKFYQTLTAQTFRFIYVKKIIFNTFFVKKIIWYISADKLQAAIFLNYMGHNMIIKKKISEKWKHDDLHIMQLNKLDL